MARQRTSTLFATTVFVGGFLAACTGVIDVVLQPDGTNFSTIPSEFSTAPVSPGGTGGVFDPQDIETGGKATQSFFSAFQIDPVSESTAGPKFVTAADIDGDGLIDLVSGWNESQPVQLHLQRRGPTGNIFFRTINLGGTSPISVIAGIETGFINDDEFPDIVVLVKATGFVTVCPEDPPRTIGVMDGRVIVLFNPGQPQLITDGDSWQSMTITTSTELPGFDAASAKEVATRPELGGYTALAVGEVDGQPGDDIVAALNVAECEALGEKPPVNKVYLFPNPGGTFSEFSDAWTKVEIELDLPQVSDVALLDVDGDGDLDIVSAWTNSISQNVRWTRNPLVNPDGPSGTAAVLGGVDNWEARPIGTIATGANIITIGDVDGDGFDDVVVRSTNGQIVQWFRRPSPFVTQPEFPPGGPTPTRFNFPWNVYTIFEFDSQEPEAIALGDVTGNGQLDLLVSAEGQIFWMDGSVSGTVFDMWTPNKIIGDGPAESTAPGTVTPVPPSTTGGVASTGVVDVSTHINNLLMVDIDGDGRLDVIGTLDRRSKSGLTNDQLIWYRNTRTEE